MEIFSHYFGKSLEDVSLSDLESYFSIEQQESNRIEFKSYDSRGKFEKKLEGVLSSICAFLNSEGGIIIWGAPKGQKPEGRNEKVFKGQLTYIDHLLEKDRLINIVSDRITPLPMGISFRTLEKEGSYIYLFVVSESSAKPHQTNNKYMIRLDGQSRIAPHYYIESMFKQIKYPEIEGYVNFDECKLARDKVEVGITTTIFNWSPIQNEKNVIIVKFSPHGVFKDALGSPERLGNKYHEYNLGGFQSITRHLDDILFYGSPFQSNDTLLFNVSDITEETLIEFILRFGGEYSPQKESYYKFKIKINEDYTAEVQIIERQENKLVSAIREELGINKEEALKKYLNR